MNHAKEIERDYSSLTQQSFNYFNILRTPPHLGKSPPCALLH